MLKKTQAILDDKEIVNQILNSNEKALFMFYSKYSKVLYSFISAKISDTSVVDELVQDVIIQFLEKARDFRFECSLKSFLISIAKYKIIDYIRKKKVKSWLVSHVPEFVIDECVHVILDTELENKELRMLVEKVFSLIPHDYALVLRLKYMESLSVKEISKKISKSFKSTESLIFRARKTFMDQYEKCEKNYSFVADPF